MKRIRILYFAIYISFSHAIYAEEAILFLGFQGDNAPAIEETMDELLRERLSVIPGVKLVDYRETLRYRHDIDFDRFSTLPLYSVDGLNEVISDTVLVIWGSIKNLRIEAIRRHLIGSGFRGELVTSVSVYDLSSRRFSHIGDIHSEALKKKGFIFFTPPERAITATSTERTEISRDLMEKTITQITGILTSLARNRQDNSAGAPPGNPDGSTARAPSISDVFTVPSMEPAKIRDPMERPKPDSIAASAGESGEKQVK